MKIVLLFISISIFCLSYEITIPQAEYQKRVDFQGNRYDGISSLWKKPYSLNGENIKISVFDGGKIFTNHIELKDRKIFQDTNLSLCSHTTSMAGIILAKGVNKKVRGIANQATLYNFFYKTYNYDKAVLKAVKEGITISNHSYSDDFVFEKKPYTQKTQNIDRLIYRNPTHIALFAAGNTDRHNTLLIKNISTNSTAKNILTISALDANGKKLTKISPKGPTNDFRIKPDFVYRGLFILVPDIDTSTTYHLYRGTSYSTAFVTGIVALISQAYKNRFDKDITFDTLKSIMIVTADDVIRQGVDIFSGYGKPNTKKAVDMILDRDFLKKTFKGVIKQNQKKTFEFKLKKPTHFKVSLCWIDPPASLKSQKALVNDIDITLFSDKKTYFPYTVNEQNLHITKAPNHHDNCEVIEEDLGKGKYQLSIKGYKVKGYQNFSLVSNTLFL